MKRYGLCEKRLYFNVIITYFGTNMFELFVGF